MIGVVVACLAGCVVVIAWPGAGVLARLGGPVVAGDGARRAGAGDRVRAVVRALAPDRRAVLGVAGVVAVLGLVLGGPVAALVGAVYAGLGMSEWVRRARRKRAAAGRAAALDGLAALVADLRAGLPPALAASSSGSVATGAVGSVGTLDGDGRVARLTGAVWRLAEHTGAPAADLLERIETDARAADRAAASAAAQAAGAQATALLLAALPLGGIGLGYAIGADPLQVLLGTPVGAACAVAAVLLQCGGLLWAQRLVSGPR
ncbi:hypothetical protein [Actinoplanes palleronii]|uniref:Tight adherence protein B n=1 Tax=Actinoplanes palleronii TaxID=113570 RepID=A0ABQ4BAG3_9ACTN|nr:hypothetical protein [Actinoplanes palleronii]GIE67702.1 hypothetical protein Apa02nite_038100 [Actinoplanes palleronii]